MKTRSIVLICMCVVSLAFFSGAFLFPPSSLAAVSDRPLFEKNVGTGDSAEADKLGEWTVEEDVTDYEKFYYPAAFCSDEKRGVIFVLDSAKNRICSYDLAGKEAGEIKIPYDFQPVDIAWSSKSGTLFVAFSDKPQIAVLKVEIKDALSLKSHKLADLGGMAGRKPGIQNIWSFQTSSEERDDIIAATFNSGYDAPGAAFLYSGERMIKLCDIDKQMTCPVASGERLAVYSVYSEGTFETGLLAMDIRNQKMARTVLASEFVPKDKGLQCVSCRPIGSDASGNIYIEAHFSSGEISSEAFVYKFDRNLKQLGRKEVFTSPEMLSNRFIYVDASGSVYYMKLDIKNKKIQFYKFSI